MGKQKLRVDMVFELHVKMRKLGQSKWYHGKSFNQTPLEMKILQFWTFSVEKIAIKHT